MDVDKFKSKFNDSNFPPMNPMQENLILLLASKVGKFEEYKEKMAHRHYTAEKADEIIRILKEEAVRAGKWIPHDYHKRNGRSR